MYTYLLFIESETIMLSSAQNSLPIVLDINGDMKTDILGYSKDTNQLSIWVNNALSESTDTSSLYNL
jgi:integrin alpha FG-GAP repeat containing protein 1